MKLLGLDMKLWGWRERLIFGMAVTVFGMAVTVCVLSLANIGYGLVGLLHAQPAINDIYPVTFEQADFPPATAGQVSFVSPAAPKNRIVLVFRNGQLQRPCPSAGPVCDYTKTGTSIITVTYQAGVIQPGDAVTMLYFR